MPKSQSDYEARLSGQRRIKFDPLGFFHVHLNLSTLAFLHFARIKMQPPQLGSNLRPRAQQRNATASVRRVRLSV